MGVTFVRRELVDVAEIDRFRGRRKKAEYEEPCVHVKKGFVNHTLSREARVPIGAHLWKPVCLAPPP